MTDLIKKITEVKINNIEIYIKEVSNSYKNVIKP